MASPARPAAAPPTPRERRLELLSETPLDVLVVGGGITGSGIALDLTLRGLRVGLVERGDWAGATSSASSRLVHGGLRYLEQMDVGLVRDSCLERGLLLKNAAGLVWPDRFTYPIHREGPLARWKLAAGLWLYTAVSVPRVLGRPHLFGPGHVRDALPGVRTDGLVGGGDYLDGATLDARLTLAVMRTAADAGAITVSRAEVDAIENGDSGARARVSDRLGEGTCEVEARAIVLAGGPSTDALRAIAGLGTPEQRWVQPTRGVHLMVARERLPTDGCIIFNSCVDGRVMFLIARPSVTIVGTTDVDADPSADVRATADEVDYLLRSVNGLVPSAEVGADDVLSTYAGLRPLLAADESDPSARSREERIAREQSIYTIAGGKLTGYRSMAETLGARLARDLGTGLARRASPTRDTRLRGALARPVERPDWSSLGPDGAPRSIDPLQTMWLHRYGSLAPDVQAMCEARGGLEPLAPDVLTGEVDWAVEQEDCLTAEDFFLRRTDLGLGRVERARQLAPAVLDRLASLLGWDAERVQEEHHALCRAVAARHAWRD